jgi:hypothetical protein
LVFNRELYLGGEDTISNINNRSKSIYSFVISGTKEDYHLLESCFGFAARDFFAGHFAHCYWSSYWIAINSDFVDTCLDTSLNSPSDIHKLAGRSISAMEHFKPDTFGTHSRLLLCLL